MTVIADMLAQPCDLPPAKMLAFSIFRAVATLLHLLLALVVALWNFPGVPTPVEFFLVAATAFLNIQFVSFPLQYLLVEWMTFRNSRPNPTRSCECEYCKKNIPFRQFARLPCEIRRMIWRVTLPHRVVELNIPEFAVRPSDCTFDWTSKANNSPPAVATICWESRDVALWHCTLKSDMQRAKDHLSRPLPGSFWSRSVHPLVQPSRALTWFNKANDTVLLYHSPYWASRSAWNALNTRIALYGHLAANRTAVYAAMVNPWPRCLEHHPEHGVASGPNVPWPDPIFVLKIVVIHASVEEARSSGLFGLASDEHIKLVDPLDTNLLMEFIWFTRKVHRGQGRDAVAFFDAFLDNVGQWEVQVQAWRRDGLTRDLWTAWMAEYHLGFAGIVNPGGVFDGPRWRNGNVLDMRDPASYRTSETGGPIDFDQYGPNENHPWVQDFLQRLPTFRPRIEFRHCADSCVPIPPDES